MKIGIITFNGAHNYGAQIQVFAMQTYLVSLGHDVKVINYRIPEIAKSYRVIKHKKRKNKLKGALIYGYEYLDLYTKKRYKLRKRDKFEYFINNHLNVTDEYTTIDELRSANFDFDIMLSGSDQVWNFNLTKGLKPAFFLDFGNKDIKRISYAASLGIEEIPDSYKNIYKKYLSNLDNIAVREESAKDLLTPLTDKDVEVVLDPTFLVDRSVYDEILVKPTTSEKYIYMHMLVEDELLLQYVKEASERLNLPIIHNKDNKYFDNELYLANDTGPKEFLGLISNAEYVFTNSFHATALSIIFNKLFVTIPHKKYPTRMVNLLSKFDLLNFLLGTYDSKFLIEKQKIDYKSVNKIMKNSAASSKQYLDKALVLDHKDKKTEYYFKTNNEFSCYGCTACKSACPVDAIKMIEDKEGFIYPFIDKEKCIKCGMCEKVCTYKKSKLFEDINNQEVYAAKNLDDKVRLKSTSGGVFSNLAEDVINNGGYVVGVSCVDKIVKYDIASTLKECELFRGSKYVRANVDDIYLRVKKLLVDDKLVLFSGTPCVVAGLKSYLMKKYDNLILVDIICHSNSSHKIFTDYIDKLELEYNSKVKSIVFRDKTTGWRDSRIKILFKNNEMLENSVYTNDYTANFLIGNISRPVCHSCEFSSQNRVSDITIGDYWGIDINNKSFDDGKGTSLILVNSEKGKELFSNITDNINSIETLKSDALLKNHKAPITLSANRYNFFENYKTDDVKEHLIKFNSRKKAMKASFIFGNLFPRYIFKNNMLKISSLCVYKSNKEVVNLKNSNIIIGDCVSKPNFLLSKGILIFPKIRLNYYNVKFDITKMMHLDIQNKVIIEYKTPSLEFANGMLYNLFDLGKGKGKNSKLWSYSDDTTFYFRQSSKNGLYFTVRDRKLSDASNTSLKIFFAKIVSKIFPKKDIILLFEKDSNRYEESASVLYEKLIDMGYKNVYYIIDKNYEHFDRINEKYMKNLLYKCSFKHYVYFFKSKTFIGTESMAHSIDLRIANRYAVNKLSSKDINYVFLQHGVMYMISLDAGLRKSIFRTPHKTHKVVVSSKEEANHFITLGNMNENSLYITGLPKYDRNILHENANKIVIMLTWRRWEFNDVRSSFESTNYYKLIKKIVDNIPKKYHKDIIILPHPLFINFVKNNDSFLNKFIPNNFVYDDILKDTKLLITDYSSISYDAFYRGSNVIFCWKEKEACLLNYGVDAKLMLNEKNVFGDVFYDEKDVKNLVEKNYNSSQSKKYMERYKKIVEFNDGNNTDRLINMLIEDKIIKDLGVSDEKIC